VWLCRYADAAAGPKDVVLVIDDQAASAAEMVLVVEAAVWALNTMSATDFGGLVTTSGQTVPLNTMSGSNKAQLRAFIETSVEGRAAASSDVVAAFSSAFDLWDGVTGSGCSKTILYVSSGPHAGSASAAAGRITARNSQMNGGPANIFASVVHLQRVVRLGERSYFWGEWQCICYGVLYARAYHAHVQRSVRTCVDPTSYARVSGFGGWLSAL
jgi:hypothetical protein